MSRLSLFNIFIGFMAVSLAASGGAFVANDLTGALLQDQALMHSWEQVLLRSSHGHTNLFGFLHIALGLTFAYSPLPLIYKKLQTIGLCCGTIAMGPGLIFRAFNQPADNVDALAIFLGFLLSLALLTLVSHCGALAFRLMKRS